MGLDLVIILLLAGGFMLGFYRGAVRQLTSIGAWLVAFLLAAHLSGPAGRLLVEQAPTYSVQYATFLSFGTLFVLLLGAGALVFQVYGANVALTRRELLDNIIGGLSGTLLVILVIAGLLVVLDSYFAQPAPPTSAEFGVLRDAYALTLDSAIANSMRQTLIPLLGGVLGPILPADLRTVMA